MTSNPFIQEKDMPPIDLWEHADTSEPFDRLEKQIREACTPILPNDYLDLNSTNKERLDTLINQRFAEVPLSNECICCVIIPAHNEESNITATLDALADQTFSTESGLLSSQFEILIIDNNSIDKTGEKIEEWVATHPNSIQVRHVALTFPQDESSAGSARKLGTDLEILRAMQSNHDFKELYFVGLDGDNAGIPPDHLEKVVTTFRSTGAKVLGGSVEFDEEIYRTIFEGKSLAPLITSFLEYKQIIKDLTKSKLSKNLVNSTSGANHAVEANWYMQIRGYPPKRKTGEDTYIGRATKFLGEEITYLDSTVEINPRRMLLDPKAYNSGDAWTPEEFEKNNERVRRGEINLEMTDTEVVEAISRTLDDFASNVLETDGVSWHDAVKEVRNTFNDICDRNNVPSELQPSNDLFFVPAKKLFKMVKKGDSFIYKKGDKPPRGDYKGFIFDKTDGLVTLRVIEKLSDDLENLVFVKTDAAGVPEIKY